MSSPSPAKDFFLVLKINEPFRPLLTQGGDDRRAFQAWVQDILDSTGEVQLGLHPSSRPPL
jgi:hypothetical protein